MTKPELNKYIASIEKEVSYTIQENKQTNYTLTLKPLDFTTVTAIANNISNLVVTESGHYRPELKDVLLLYHVLNEASEINFTEFNETEIFKIFNSKIGYLLLEQLPKKANWMNYLKILTRDKIEYRKSLYCSPNKLVNQKLSLLLSKELEVQNKMLEATQYMENLQKTLSPEDISSLLSSIQNNNDNKIVSLNSIN